MPILTISKSRKQQPKFGIYERLLDMEKGDMLLLICYSRYTDIDDKLREIAINKEVTYCVITDKAISPAANGAIARKRLAELDKYK